MKIFDIKKWILTAGIFVILAGWFFLVHQKNAGEVRSLKKRLEYLRAESGKNIPESRILEMGRTVDSLQTALQKKRSRVFPEQNFQDLGKNMGQTLEKHGLKILSIRPEYESLKAMRENREEIFELPVQMELKGEFRSFTKWLDSSGEIPFAVKFSDFLFNKDPANITLEIKLKGMVLLGKAAEAKGKTAKTGGESAGTKPSVHSPSEGGK